MANCGLQVVLDEEQAIQYLVKYYSKPGKWSTSINGPIQTMLSAHYNSVKEYTGKEYKSEEESREPQNSPPASGTTLIFLVALHSIGQRNKNQQEIIHLLLK